MSEANDMYVDCKLFQLAFKTEPVPDSETVQSVPDLKFNVETSQSVPSYGENIKVEYKEEPIDIDETFDRSHVDPNDNINFEIENPITVHTDGGSFKVEFKEEIETIDSDETNELKIVLENQDLQTNETRKLKRNSGLAYVTKKGKIVKKRKSKELEYCKRRCGEKISKELREKCFNEYWNLGTYSKRLTYASKRIQINRKSRITNLTLPKKQRNFTCKYFIIDDKRNNIEICKRCYTKIYDESYGFISSVIKKNTTGIDLIDFRGSFESGKKISDQQLCDIECHIESFPAYESYYTKKLYLAEGLNLTMMYNLYLKKYRTSKVSYAKYRNIFNSLNLRFTRPQSEVCSKCCRFEARIKVLRSQNDKDDLITLSNRHREYSENAYKIKQIDIADIHKTVLCVDLQYSLPTPDLKCTSALYKRKLWTFYLTIRNCNDNTTHCYIWDETISASGANQTASCIFKYLNTKSNLKSHIVIYSDTSIGQNRNSVVATMFQYLMTRNTKFEMLEHKFLEPGHIHLDCGGGHSVIEKKKKSNIPITHPHDWAQLIRSCASKNILNVCEMKIEEFFDFSQLQKQYFKKTLKNQQKEKIIWNDIRILRYTKGNWDTISYKTCYTDTTFQIMVTKKSGNIHFNLHQLNYAPLYITDEKKADLLELFDVIPPVFHTYYRELKSKPNMKELCYIEEESDCDENYI